MGSLIAYPWMHLRGDIHSAALPGYESESRHCHRVARQKGISLAEILIALTIMAGMSVAVTAGLSNVIRATRNVANSAADLEEFRVGARALRDLIAANVMPPLEFVDEKMLGTEKMLSMLAVGQDDNWVRVKLSVEHTPYGRETLAVTIAPFPDDAGEVHTGKIFRDGKNYEFSYFGTADYDDPNASLSWRSDWDSVRPPTLIAFEGEDEYGESFRFELHNAQMEPLWCDRGSSFCAPTD